MKNAIPLSPNQKSAKAIRRYLVALLLGLQLITVSIITAISHFTLSEDVRKQSNIIIENAVKESKEHTLGFLEPAYRNVQQTVDLIEKSVLDVENDKQLETFFLSLLEKNMEFNGIYIAENNGDFFFVSRNSDIDNAHYLTKKISGNKLGVADFFWRDEQLNLIDNNIDQADSYNFKERPWYIQAIERNTLIWTDPYIFFTSNALGMTIAIPYRNSNGDVIGAVGLDITLTELSEFFSQLNIYGSISAFMVSGSEKFIAAPSFSEENKTISSLDFSGNETTGKPIERFAANYLVENLLDVTDQSLSGQFTFQDKDYTIHYDAFTIDNGPTWIIGAYAPTNTFLEALEYRDKRNIAIAIFVLILSIAIGFYFIKRTWRPFDKLVSLIVVDQLTDLYNQHFLKGIGSSMYLQMLREQNTQLSIALIDIDNFTAINSEFGNTIGDKTIAKFAEFLRSTISDGDVITRYSGDRFIIMLTGLDRDRAHFKIDEIRLKLDSWPLNVDKLLIRLTFSAGIITVNGDHEAIEQEEEPFETFITQAKDALDQAKDAGRDRVISIDKTKKKFANRSESAKATET